MQANRTRNCFKCGKKISYEHFQLFNSKKLTPEDLEEIWNSDLVEIYCCSCYAEETGEVVAEETGEVVAVGGGRRGNPGVLRLRVVVHNSYRVDDLNGLTPQMRSIIEDELRRGMIKALRSTSIEDIKQFPITTSHEWRYEQSYNSYPQTPAGRIVERQVLNYIDRKNALEWFKKGLEFCKQGGLIINTTTYDCGVLESILKNKDHLEHYFERIWNSRKRVIL